MGESPAGPDLTLTQHRSRVGTLVGAALQRLRDAGYEIYWTPVRQYAEVDALHRLEPDLQRSVVIDLVDRRASGSSVRQRILHARTAVDDRVICAKLISSFANRAIPYTRDDAAILLHLTDTILRRSPDPEMLDAVPVAVAAAERVARAGTPDDLDGPIRRVADALGRLADGGIRAAKYRARLVALVGDEQGALDPHMVTDGDSWGATWKGRLAQIPPSLRPLMAHLPLVGSVEPTQKWKATAQELAADPDARELLRHLLADVETTRLQGDRVMIGGWLLHEGQIPTPSFQDRNALVLRGVIWAAALSGADWAPDRLVAIGIACGTSGTGSNEAREVRLANACAAALGAIDTEASFVALGRMKAKITNRNVSKQIAKALDAAAGRRGSSPSELLELAIPTEGLDADGRSETPIDDVVAVHSIAPDGGASLAWRSADGIERATPPKRLVEEHPAEVRRVKDRAKDLRKALSIERGRIEDLFVEDRAWDLTTWRTRYVEHPVTGSFGRRLVWQLVDAGTGPTTTVMPAEDGGYVAADGTAVVPADGASVRLWHPIDAAEADVAAWRGAILERRIRQPFKQAFREVYVRTPAEEQTDTYSNRFAGHILLYGQARALMTARRWASNFLGPFDGGDAGLAKKEFPSHRIRAEFYHDALYDEMERGGDVEHCTTDQVRFLPMGRGPGAPLPLRDVPPIVFSETMRDVDLFVGVTSIGADRNWQDGGQHREGRFARFDDYFGDYSRGELTASAAVRRDAIARILPGLVIADRCELEDRWLRVRGDVRSYRIHLGSGNILMEPNDRYLCIVPARGEGPASKVFLPFDDDPVLALVLSKAFLLANDTAIRDRSIIRQIEQR